MATAANTVPLGPFLGGLNTKSDQSALADNELYVCENFELDFDGSLRSRPSYLDDPADMPLANGAGQGTLLGYFQAPNGVTYLIGSDGATTTYAYNGSNWVTVTATVAAAAITQFNGKLWMTAAPASGQKGGSWDGVTFTTDTNMPLGLSIVAYRSILYVGVGAGSSRLYYSGPITGTLWSATPNFVDVGYGDGQSIMALVPLNNTLLVMRNSSLWSYSWATTPAGAQVTPVDTSVGLDNPLAVAVLDGIVYFTFELKAYSFLNGRASQINDRVPLVASSTSNFARPIAVSVLGTRVLYSFYDVVFVYSTDTYTWSTWVSPTWGAVGKFYQRTGFRDRFALAYTAVSLNAAAGTGRTMKVLSITEGIDPTYGETFDCTAVTKVFDYGTTSQYKRLFWWGLDALFRLGLVATVVPVSYQSQVTWGQLLGKTWGSMLNQTWAQPATASLAVTTNRSAIGTGPQRKFVKLSKSLRFRQAYFRIVIATDGTANTAPVKLFSVSTFVRIGERVSKSIA